MITSRPPLNRESTVVDILGLGCVTLDDYLHVAAFPGRDDKVQVLARYREVGGLTANALAAASRLGATCAFGGLLGLDAASEFVANELADAGVAVDCAPRAADTRPILSTVVVASDGARVIYFDDRCRSGPPDQPDIGLVRSARVLIVDGYGVPGSIVAATEARRLGIPVVADCESVQNERLSELLDLVDHVILPVRFALSLTGADSPSEAVNSLWSDTRALVAVTSGALGVTYRTRDTRGARSIPAYTVRATDTTACGDVFHGAYAAAIATGDAPELALRLASAAAALAASGHGWRAFPKRAAVEALMASMAL